MSEIIDRMARAAYEAMRMRLGGEHPLHAWEEQSDQLKDDWRQSMRDGLAAAREPDKAMAEAGIRAAEDCTDSGWDSGPHGEDHSTYETLRSDAPVIIFRAMIDEILK